MGVSNLVFSTHPYFSDTKTIGGRGDGLNSFVNIFLVYPFNG